ncbi:MAG: class I SAM-dependent methyltransferase [Verrucomicrobiota bacterium]
MNYRELPRCLICDSDDLTDFLDLGEQPLSGVFPAVDDPDPVATPLVLRRCGYNDCGHVQLSAVADLDKMYGQTYGYFSGISPLMRAHLGKLADEIKEAVDLQPGDSLLDIGCNDCTLLNNFANSGYSLFGIDPSAEKFRHRAAPEIEAHYDFFSGDALEQWQPGRKFRVISSIAMFYDLEKPHDFVADIANLLTPDGIWVVELADMDLFLRNLTYDQICHEHLLYLGIDQMVDIGRKAGMKLFALSKNEINGGSFRLWFAKNDCANFEDISKDVAFSATADQCERFARRVIDHRDQVREFIQLIRGSGKTIGGYGASTKGNIVLHHCGITKDDLPWICDRNPEKDGRLTPGTRIPMISREEGRKRAPDVFIVLCWHFRKEVIEDEQEYLKNGGCLVFLLPRIHVVSAANADFYLDNDFSDLAYAL